MTRRWPRSPGSSPSPACSSPHPTTTPASSGSSNSSSSPPTCEEVEDAGRVVPAAFAVLAVPRDLLAEAAAIGALDAGSPATDPLGDAVDTALVRTLAWVVALNGALLTDALVTGLPTTGRSLGEHLTDTLLLGWGASPDALAEARDLAATLPVDGVPKEGR